VPCRIGSSGQGWRLGTYGGLNRWKNGQITIPRTGHGKQDGKLNGQAPNSLFQDDRGRIWISTNAGVGYLENDPCMASARTRREVYGLPTRLAVFFIMVVPLRGTHGGATPNTQSSLPEGQPGE
jgi:hypothetical protein